jgi:hypothetical protein
MTTTDTTDTTTEKTTEKNLLSIADPTGDTRLMWDPTDRDETKIARAAFDKAKARGMLAYSVNPKDGSKGQVIHEFDPQAEKIIMTKQLQGG